MLLSNLKEDDDDSQSCLNYSDSEGETQSLNHNNTEKHKIHEFFKQAFKKKMVDQIQHFKFV